MKIFVTSNQQFGRLNAITKYKRPFTNVEDMNAALINAWNSTVSNEDLVYVLGNFAWDPETAEIASKQLNGAIAIVLGEFDAAIEEILDSELVNLENVDFADFEIRYFKDANATLSYWPLSEWQGKAKGAYSIIGYPSKKHKTNHKTRVINCACDNWDFKPVEVSKMIELLTEVNEDC